MKNIIYHKCNLPADLIPLRAYTFLTGVRIIPVFYHTVSLHPLSHLNNLYKVSTPGEFEKDIDFLLKNFEPVTLQSLIKSVKENEPFKKPSFFLSFDDGLSEFYDIIAPVLFRKGVAATCFLNSAFVDNKDIFYRYKACLLLNEINDKATSLLPVFKIWLENKGLDIISPQKFLLTIEYHNKSLIDELALVLEYSFDEYLRMQQPYLSSTQIKSLIQQGFTFGSHSIDHPGFNTISYGEQIRQVVESTLEVVRCFNLPYRVFSFPFTDYAISSEFFDKINKSVNFDLTFGCAGIKKDIQENHIQRIPLEEHDLNAEKRIKRDFFYYILKTLINKNAIRRK